MSDTIDVTDGDVTESAKIVETYEYNGETVAEVIGSTVGHGFVVIN